MRTDAGQATVEAAFMIPVLFATMLILLQPGIVLYDRMVMEHAAAEGCRLLATSTGAPDSSKERCEELIKRRLGAIPQQDLFHVHAPDCSYRVSLEGGDSDSVVTVEISNRIRLLPFNIIAPFSQGASDGCMELKVVRTTQVQPEWVAASSGGADPDAWVHGRD